MPLPHRSSSPLAAAGVVALGLVPLIGGPSKPLHWAMSACIVSAGVLLWSRGRSGEPLRANNEGATQVGRVVLTITAVLAALVAIIVGWRWLAGGSISLLSVAMPLAGLAWLAGIGVRSLRLGLASAPPNVADRPSRRPPRPDRFSPHPPGRPSSPAGRISA